MNEERQSLPPHTIREIAAAAQVHPVTVARVLAGKPTRALNRERVEKALAAAGLAGGRKRK
jgi:DNA-binding LacI/PurR family transcriptional regulator